MSKAQRKSSKGKKPKQDPKTGLILVGVAQDTNKNGTAGRPSDYDPKFTQMMIDFFNVKPYEDMNVSEEIDVQESVDAKGTKKTRTRAKRQIKRVASELPTFEKFSFDINVHRRTLHQWATITTDPSDETAPLKYPEFSYAYSQCQQLQKYFLIQNGLQGTYPSAAFIFVAQNATDMVDAKTVHHDETAKENLNAISQWANTLRHDVKSTL